MFIVTEYAALNKIYLNPHPINMVIMSAACIQTHSRFCTFIMKPNAMNPD